MSAQSRRNLMKKSAITSGSFEARCPESVTIKKEVPEERTICEVRPSLLNVVVKSGGAAGKRNKKNCTIDLARELVDHHAMVK